MVSDLWRSNVCSKPTPVVEEIDIGNSPPTKDEVHKAIKPLKINKAAGIDSTSAELFETDTNISSKI